MIGPVAAAARRSIDQSRRERPVTATLDAGILRQAPFENSFISDTVLTFDCVLSSKSTMSVRRAVPPIFAPHIRAMPAPHGSAGGRVDPMRDSLDVRLAELSRDVLPPANVWHGVVAEIVSRPRRGRPAAFATMAAGIMVASAVAWAVLHGRPGSVIVSALDDRAASFDEPRDARYAAARTTLETIFRERLALLDPTTRAQIRSSLAVIRQAHEDLHKALAIDPVNPVLQQRNLRFRALR